MRVAPTSPHPTRAFTLIELVIVVVLIGIIAAIAIPRLSRGAEDAKWQAVKADSIVLQQAVDLYTAEHDGRSPALDADGNLDTDSQRFMDRLLQRTDENGELSALGTFGPYLRTFPRNPFTTCGAVRVSGDPAPSDCAWFYDTGLGSLRPDHSSVLDPAEHPMHW